MKYDKITARQSFDPTNGTTLQFSTVAEATAWVEREMQDHRLATYSIYRNSTNRLLRQWELGNLTIDRASK